MNEGLQGNGPGPRRRIVRHLQRDGGIQEARGTAATDGGLDDVVTDEQSGESSVATRRLRWALGALGPSHLGGPRRQDRGQHWKAWGAGERLSDLHSCGQRWTIAQQRAARGGDKTRPRRARGTPATTVREIASSAGGHLRRGRGGSRGRHRVARGGVSRVFHHTALDFRQI